MRKSLIALVAAAGIASAAMAASGPAEARWGNGWGYPVGGGDWRSGVELGGFGYAYGYHGSYYGFVYPYHTPPCHRRDVWNGYGWVPAC